MSEKRDAYVQKLKENINQWSDEIDKFQVKAEKTKADVQVQFKKHIEELKAKRHGLEGKLADLQKADEKAWEDIKGGVDKAWHALGESFTAAKSRFDK
jgi:chromosome segregation ATPase